MSAKHTITASAATGGNISPVGSVSVKAGDSKTFTITANSGYEISSVTVDGANKGAINSYTFADVKADHTISAAFSGGGGGSSSSGTGTPPPTVTEEKPAKPAETTLYPPTIGSAKIAATVDKNGNANLKITDQSVADAIKKAQADAKKKGTEKSGIAVELVVDTGKQKPNSISATLPKTVQDMLVREKVAELSVKSETVSLTFDEKALLEIQKQSGGDVTINASKADVNKLSPEAKNEVGDRPVFDLSITGKDGKTISDFGGGFVTVSVPYTLKDGENPNNLQAYFIDANGKIHEVTCTYNPDTKCLVFVTNHFSIYGIGYKENAPKFTDIEKHWAKNDIEFVAARGLISGTGKNVFSPDAPITTGEFLAALSKISGKDMGNLVKDDKKQVLTRAKMAEIMFEFTKITNFKLATTREKIKFTDTSSEIVSSLQTAGIIMGKDGGKFDFAGVTTKAVASAVLRRYIELSIDNSTAQGLDVNDSGKFVYYENGKLFVGTKTIGGTTYHFGKDGICVKIDAIIPENPKYIFHTIVRGDTLWAISRKHKCTVAEIAAINGIKNPNRVSIGTVLKIPQK